MIFSLLVQLKSSTSNAFTKLPVNIMTRTQNASRLITMPFVNAKVAFTQLRIRSQQSELSVRKVSASRVCSSLVALCAHSQILADSTVADLPTLLGVTTGIAVLAGLICMVLHLFSKTKYPRARHFADAHLGPPVLFASDTGN